MAMENLKVKLKSGAQLEVWPAHWKQAHSLYKAVLREMQRIDFENDTTQKLSMAILSSELVEEAMWPCLLMATYTGTNGAPLKCTPELFESLEARCDFQEIYEGVISYNIAPFSKNVDSLLKTVFQKSTGSPE